MENLGSIFIMARDPYGRIRSEFNWHFRSTPPEDRPDINQWTIESLAKATIDGDYADNHFRACIDFIDEDLPCSVFKIEDGFNFVVEGFLRKDNWIGSISIPVEKNAKRFSSPIQKLQLNDSAIQAINQFYKYDFEAFGYTPIASKDSKSDTKPLVRHEKYDDCRYEAKARTIRKWRRETINRLNLKVRNELQLICKRMNNNSNTHLNDLWIQPTSATTEGPKSPNELYDKVLSKIDFTTQIIKSLASSEQDMQSKNPGKTQELLHQCNELWQNTQIINISKTIQLLDHYRGILRISA